jgi:PAS domain-containing protein
MNLLLSSGQPMFLAWGAEKTWFYNDAFTPILGDKHPHALGERSDVVWKEAWETLKPLFDRVFAGQPVQMEDFGLLLHRYGRLQEAHFSFSYTPVFAESGEVTGLFGVCLETTAQVIAIREREAAETRLQLALSAGDGIGTWDWDIKNDRVVADDRFAHLYGVDPALAKAGAPISLFMGHIHSQDLPIVQRRIDAALRAASDYRSEYRLHQRDGSIRWVIAQGRVIADAEGVPIRFSGATFDITERKNAEEALYRLNANLESEVDSRTRERDRVWSLSPDLMAVTDTAGKIVRSNPAWQTLLGWTAEELTADSYLDLLHPDDV